METINNAADDEFEEGNLSKKKSKKTPLKSSPPILNVDNIHNSVDLYNSNNNSDIYNILIDENTKKNS